MSSLLQPLSTPTPPPSSLPPSLPAPPPPPCVPPPTPCFSWIPLPQHLPLSHSQSIKLSSEQIPPEADDWTQMGCEGGTPPSLPSVSLGDAAMVERHGSESLLGSAVFPDSLRRTHPRKRTLLHRLDVWWDRSACTSPTGHAFTQAWICGRVLLLGTVRA